MRSTRGALSRQPLGVSISSLASSSPWRLEWEGSDWRDHLEGSVDVEKGAAGSCVSLAAAVVWGVDLAPAAQHAMGLFDPSLRNIDEGGGQARQQNALPAIFSAAL